MDDELNASPKVSPSVQQELDDVALVDNNTSLVEEQRIKSIADLEQLFQESDQEMVARASCSCARIRDYMSSDQTLDDVDHLCPDVARNSCLDWLWENWGYQDGNYKGRVVVPLDSGRVTDAKDIYQWPIPLKGEGRMLYGVIRQFVEESDFERSSYLSREIKKHPQWILTLDRLRERVKLALAPNDTFDLRSLDLEELRSSNNEWVGLGTVLQELGRAGLPRTPATAQYVLSQLDGKPRQEPSRGLLITTFLICSTQFYKDGSNRDFLEPEESIQKIVWVAPWITKEILSQSALKALAHSSWWKTLRGVHVSPVNLKGRPKAPERECLDADIIEYQRGTLTRKEVRKRALLRANPADGILQPEKRLKVNKATDSALSKATKK